jgi:hypothetical protein
MNYEYFTLLVSLIITAGFIWWLEIKDKKMKSGRKNKHKKNIHYHFTR